MYWTTIHWMMIYGRITIINAILVMTMLLMMMIMMIRMMAIMMMPMVMTMLILTYTSFSSMQTSVMETNVRGPTFEKQSCKLALKKKNGDGMVAPFALHFAFWYPMAPYFEVWLCKNLNPTTQKDQQNIRPKKIVKRKF